MPSRCTNRFSGNSVRVVYYASRVRSNVGCIGCDVSRISSNVSCIRRDVSGIGSNISCVSRDVSRIGSNAGRVRSNSSIDAGQQC